MKKLVEQFNLLNLNEQIYLLSILHEGIKSARELYLDKIGEENFDRLTKIDPSKNNKYLDWICKQYLTICSDPKNPYGDIEIWRLKKVIKDFDSRISKNIIKNKDIYYYKNVEELEDIIEKSPDKSKIEQEKHIKATEAKIILDNDHYFIVEPLTWEASKIYGKGTKWCTASEVSNTSWISDVINKNARIFYVRNKKLNIDNPEYKIAIHVPISCFDKNKKVDYNKIPCTLWDANDKATEYNLQEVANKFGIDINKISNIKFVDLNTKEGIKEWLDLMEIKNYKVNEDLIVDVNDDINIYNKGLTEIPIQFGIVKGDFYCYHNNLKSLEGCPIKVNGDFCCSRNKLTSLEYASEIINGNFDCSFNNLKSLKYTPKEIKGYFNCYGNPNLTYDYLFKFDFSFVKGSLWTGYGDINRKRDK